MFLTILPYRKLPDLKDKIKEIDDKAFIIVSHVEEVSGNGFYIYKRNARSLILDVHLGGHLFYFDR